MSLTSGIYLFELSFINNYMEPQFQQIILRYSVDVASVVPWVITYGIRASSVTSRGIRDTNPQSGP